MIAIEETEAGFQSRVVELATSLGWDWLHIATTAKGYKSPMRGTLGAGWPDLVLLRGHRMVIAELKRQKAPPPSDLQKRVINALSEVEGIETFVWRPSDWALILDVLT